LIDLLFLAKINNEQIEIKRRFIDLTYNIPKALKIISSKAYEKMIEKPINFFSNVFKIIYNNAFGVCKKKGKNSIKKN